MKIGIILLARMGASRLPGKVLREICGKSVLEHVISRLRNVNADEIVVATTDNSKDNPIADLCHVLKIQCFRGSEENVLERCATAVEKYEFDAVVRIGTDSAVLDWNVINEMLTRYLNETMNGNRLEYLSNTLMRSYPIGLDVEIFSSQTFRKIQRKISGLPEQERIQNEVNVIPYLHGHLDEFKTFSFYKDFDYTHFRWTLDTPADLELLTKIYESLYPVNEMFLMDDILELIQNNPSWSRINEGVVPVSGYWTEFEKSRFKREFN